MSQNEAIEELPDGGEVDLQRRLRSRRASAFPEAAEVLADGGWCDRMHFQAACSPQHEGATHAMSIWH